MAVTDDSRETGHRGDIRIRLLSCVGVDLELDLLGFFLDHYLSLGVAPGDVHLVLNSADPASAGLAAADRILAERGIGTADRWIAPYTSDAMWRERRGLQERVATRGDWIVNADVDELHRYPAPLAEVATYLDESGFGALQGVMIDRLSPDGTLSAMQSDVPLAVQFPIRADVALSVIGTGAAHGVAGTVKLMMHRHDVLPNRGGHTVMGSEGHAGYAAGTRLSLFPRAADPAWRSAFPFQVDHYKWTATLRESLSRRLATEGVSVAGREYGGKIDRYLARNGRVRLQDAVVFERDAPPAPDWQPTLRSLRRSALYWKVRNALHHKATGLGRFVRRKVAA